MGFGIELTGLKLELSQKIQPPIPFVPSLFGQEKPPSKLTLITF